MSRVPGCDRRPRAFTSVGSIRIRFEVLGITRTTTFDLPSGSLAFGRRNGRLCSFLIPDDEPP